MTAQHDLQGIDQDLAASVSRSYLTALAILNDANEAEALVTGVVQNLNPDRVTSDAIRNAVIERLVQAQMRMKIDLNRIGR